jgi:hypothetical protein
VSNPLGKKFSRQQIQERSLLSRLWMCGQSQCLADFPRIFAAQMYRENWEGCRDLWKLNYHRKRVKFTVLK